MQSALHALVIRLGDLDGDAYRQCPGLNSHEQALLTLFEQPGDAMDIIIGKAGFSRNFALGIPARFHSADVLQEIDRLQAAGATVSIDSVNDLIHVNEEFSVSLVIARCFATAVRGRSYTLKVCYRTSQQIRQAADTLLPVILRDVDGNDDERRGVVSVFDGPPPQVMTFASSEAEGIAVASVISSWIAEGVAASEIGIFVRTPDLVGRARQALTGIDGAEAVSTASMHLAKGLEFRAVVVMACDEGILPLDERIADAADEAELDEIYETERRLLYVACTRAREHLLITATEPGSEYLRDISGERSA